MDLSQTGTVFPFSAISGVVKLIPPSDTALPPVKDLIAAIVSSDAANAFKGKRVTTNDAEPNAKAFLRVKDIPYSSFNVNIYATTSSICWADKIVLPSNFFNVLTPFSVL